MGVNKKSVIRKGLIAEAAKEIGLEGKVKKKKLIREYIRNHPAMTKMFSTLSDSAINKLIDINKLLSKEETNIDVTSTITGTSDYSNKEITDRLASECAKYGLPVEAVSSYKFVNHQGQQALNIAFHRQLLPLH